MQGAPLTANNVNEIERMLKYGGEVGLWIERDMFNKEIQDLAQKLLSQAIEIPLAADEFAGQAVSLKILIKDRR